MMLYEGALKFASQARLSIEAKDIEKKIYWINRTTAIYIELLNSLDYSAGEVSLYLEGLYKRELELLTYANIKNDLDAIDEVINVTKGLSEAWRENVLGANVEEVD